MSTEGRARHSDGFTARAVSAALQAPEIAAIASPNKIQDFMFAPIATLATEAG
ncbi:hypothetical protein GCM10010983_02330 [Caulobacter rhizosphaerae]|nr:hypothetical protein GCM10010983_02330 [Caulobacter rhizosphaerae]